MNPRSSGRLAAAAIFRDPVQYSRVRCFSLGIRLRPVIDAAIRVMKRRGLDKGTASGDEMACRRLIFCAVRH